MDDLKNIIRKEIKELKEAEVVQRGVAGVQKEVAELRRELFQKGISWILAGFGIMAGLAWNEAVKSLFDFLLGPTKASLMAKFVYAIVVTIVAVMVTRELSDLVGVDNSTKSEEKKSGDVASFN